MKAIDIIRFDPVEEKAPAMTCNCCGAISHYPDMRMATIYPFTTEDQDCSFVVCSFSCETAFLNFPTLDHYVIKCIDEAANIHKLSLKVEYLVWRNKLNEKVINN